MVGLILIITLQIGIILLDAFNFPSKSFWELYKNDKLSKNVIQCCVDQPDGWFYYLMFNAKYYDLLTSDLLVLEAPEWHRWDDALHVEKQTNKQRLLKQILFNMLFWFNPIWLVFNFTQFLINKEKNIEELQLWLN